jgi:hypothetical protein
MARLAPQASHSPDSNCPVCKGDGYVEVGDKPNGYGGFMAAAVDCPCIGGDIEDLSPEYQDKFLDRQWGLARARVVLAIGQFENAVRAEVEAQTRHCWGRPSEVSSGELSRYESYRAKLADRVEDLGKALIAENHAYAEWKEPTLADDLRATENEHEHRDDEKRLVVNRSWM